MKKKVLVLMVGFLFIGVNVFAADGDLTVDGNVGIGTTDPAGKLDISGGRFYLRDRGDNCCTDFRMSQGSGQETHLYSYADGRFGIHKYGAGSASGEVFSILKNGNVGIGTTSPGLGGPPRTVLHLYASAQAEMLLNSGAGSGRTWSLNVPAPGTSFRIGRSGVADDVTIDNSGNVGVGATDPTAKLHIKTGTDQNIKFSAFVNSTNGTALTASNDNAANKNDFEIIANNIILTPTGNVGIGMTDPGGYKLYVAGTAYSTGGWQSSDLRFKDNIKPIESPLDKILSIEGISFDWKKDEFKDKGFPEGSHYGVIAQRVERVLPEVVREGPGGEKSVSYTEIVPVLIEAIKEQQKEIEKLRMEITQLKTRN